MRVYNLQREIGIKFCDILSPVAVLRLTSYKCESTQDVANNTPDC